MNEVITTTLAIYLAIGTGLAFAAGANVRDERTIRYWLADLTGFAVIALCWLPIAIWAWAGRR